MLNSISRLFYGVMIASLMLPVNSFAQDLLSKLIFTLPSIAKSEVSTSKKPLSQTDILALFDAKIESWRARYNIDAVSYTVISTSVNGTKTFGSATLASLWEIASVSKNISATALVKMMGEGGFTINTLVGYDVFSDPAIRNVATIKDYMSHTTGMPGQAGADNIIFGYDLEESVSTLKFYPNDGFRTLFQYNNMMYHLGVQKASEILDSTVLDELASFFKKAGMNNTSANLAEFKDNPNLITMNDLYGETHKFNVDQGQIPSSGGIASTIGDLRTFMNLHLNPPNWLPNLSQIYTPIIASGGPNGNFYGIGTATFNTLGASVRGHLGLLTTGVSTAVLYDVDNHIGIAVLVNSPNAAPYPLFLYLYYLLRGEDVATADAVSQAVYDQLSAIIESFKCNTPLPPNTQDPSKFKDTYLSNLIGRLKLQDHTRLLVGNLTPKDVSYDGKTIGVLLRDVSDERITTIVIPQVDNNGKVTAMKATYYCGPSYIYAPSTPSVN